jgi:predicted MFS family arabinose efflux permease
VPRSTEMPRSVADKEPLTWAEKAIMLATGPLFLLAFSAVIPALPRIEAALAHSSGDRILIKQLVGIVGLAVALGAPLAGFLVDRVGPRMILAVACAIYCLAGTAGLLIHGLPLLIASRVLVGAAAGAIDTTALVLINTRLSGNEQARWMGLHMSALMIFSIISQPVIGDLAAIGWRWPFALYALCLPVGIIGVWGLRAARSDRSVSAAAGGERILASFPLRLVLLALALGTISYSVAIYGPYLLTARGAGDPRVIALVIMGQSAISAAFSMGYGRCRRRLSIGGVLGISLATAAIGCLLSALTAGFWGAVWGLLIVAVGLAWFFPNLATAVGESVAGAQQGRALGFVRTAFELSATLCVILLEPVARQFGPAGAFVAISLIAWALIVAFGVAFAFNLRTASRA